MSRTGPHNKDEAVHNKERQRKRVLSAVSCDIAKLEQAFALRMSSLADKVIRRYNICKSVSSPYCTYIGYMSQTC
jgi:hypothetical protein